MQAGASLPLVASPSVPHKGTAYPSATEARSCKAALGQTLQQEWLHHKWLALQLELANGLGALFLQVTEFSWHSTLVWL